MKTLKIEFAFAPECVALLDGAKTNVKLSCVGGNLLVEDLDNKILYEADGLTTSGMNEIKFNVVKQTDLATTNNDVEQQNASEPSQEANEPTATDNNGEE